MYVWVLQLMESMNFTQLVQCPTRTTEYSSTLIDHVFTNIPGNIIELTIHSYTLRDHFPVAITRTCNHNIATKLYHFSLKLFIGLTMINVHDLSMFTSMHIQPVCFIVVPRMYWYNASLLLHAGDMLWSRRDFKSSC